MEQKGPLIIGITGGIGAGKTSVAKIFNKNGFHTIFTDDLAKQIISNNNEIQKKIISIFGDKSFIDGQYNTEYVSELVFENNKKSNENLNKLNKIIHPAVIDSMINELEIIINDIGNTSNIIFVESALIFELELDKGFDYTISVTASEGLRIERLKSRSNLSEQQILYRMSQQFSQEEKNKNADFVIENENGISELTKAVNFLLPILLTLPNRIFIDEIAETQ